MSIRFTATKLNDATGLSPKVSPVKPNTKCDYRRANLPELILHIRWWTATATATAPAEDEKECTEKMQSAQLNPNDPDTRRLATVQRL